MLFIENKDSVYGIRLSSIIKMNCYVTTAIISLFQKYSVEHVWEYDKTVSIY